ncbi:frataxin homolog, mitochondrial [Condylostylus longicornis]|uniref:frataxin homolog, mitochondrial n=1 Tax=Condylostylus longicornis TaxID=2530218 RepID=UPI00244E17A0|nr:frataxin homolog, mitochondrial [Condylostylus longicornis]
MISLCKGLSRISKIILRHRIPQKEFEKHLRSQIRFSTCDNEQWDFVDMKHAEYERVCTETLEGLFEYFEELLDSATFVELSDVTYNDGVLTVNLGSSGTYVINRQTPNKQIWLSSPNSGPKRYDFFGSKNAELGQWKYKHTGESLHSLLQKEIKTILKKDVNFFKLPYSGYNPTLET